MEELQALLRSLRQKAAACRELGGDAQLFEFHRLAGKVEGIELAADDLQKLLQQLADERMPLPGLLTEKIQVDSKGQITAPEIRRLELKYGVRLRGDYDFVSTRDFRLADGSTILF